MFSSWSNTLRETIRRLVDFAISGDRRAQVRDEVVQISESPITLLGSVEHGHRGVVGDPGLEALLREPGAVPIPECLGGIGPERSTEAPGGEAEIPLGRCQLPHDAVPGPAGRMDEQVEPTMAALHAVVEGIMVADLVPTFGAVNMIGGELDR